MKNGIFLLMCTLFVAACGSKGGGGGGNSNGTVATTAIDSCFNGSTTYNPACNSSTYYSQYRRYGFQAYTVNPTYWQNSGYYAYSMNRYRPNAYGLSNYAAFCSCGSSARPMFLPQGGMGCLENTYMQNFIGLAYYGMNSSNQFVPDAQFANAQGYRYGGNSCYQAVARGCTIGSNECGAGLQCLPPTNGSPIGICATGANYNRGRDSGPGYGRGHDRDDDDDRYDRNDRDGRYGRSTRATYSSSGSITGGGTR